MVPLGVWIATLLGVWIATLLREPRRDSGGYATSLARLARARVYTDA